MDCVGELGILTGFGARKIPLCRGICREIGILQGFCWRTWHFNVALVQKFP